MAYLGRHEFNTSDLRTCDSWDRDPICDGYYGIPIIDVKYPENQGFSDEDSKSHDFAKNFGTKLETVWDNNNFKDIYKDTCSGDSGKWNVNI